MSTWKVNYLAPNPKKGAHPIYVHKVATYEANSEAEAIEKFNKFHKGKRHQFQFAWEETGIDKLRKTLTKKLMPR